MEISGDWLESNRACPFVTAIYDFSEPINLPLPKIGEIPLPGSGARFDAWVGETDIRLVDRYGRTYIVSIQYLTIQQSSGRRTTSPACTSIY